MFTMGEYFPVRVVVVKFEIWIQKERKKVQKEHLMALTVQHVVAIMPGVIVPYLCSDFQKMKKGAENGYKTLEGMT